MSTSIGIIEWVDDTKPLKACLGETPTFEKLFKESQAMYSEFVMKHSKPNHGLVQGTENRQSYN
jgi:hypothetical protein